MFFNLIFHQTAQPKAQNYWAVTHTCHLSQHVLCNWQHVQLLLIIIVTVFVIRLTWMLRFTTLILAILNEILWLGCCFRHLAVELYRLAVNKSNQEVDLFSANMFYSNKNSIIIIQWHRLDLLCGIFTKWLRHFKQLKLSILFFYHKWWQVMLFSLRN